MHLSDFSSIAGTHSPADSRILTLPRLLKQTLLVFLIACALVLWLNGNRFVITADEGILLIPAQQMAEGSRPYVDFFGYMSPGSYWIQAALFKLLGFALWVGRLPVLFDFALQCAILFYLTARLASQRTGFAAAAIFAGFQIADPTFLTAQHRWDSATLALLGLCFALHACAPWGSQPSGSDHAPTQRWPLPIAGALMGFAAWCTPSIALVGIVTGIWLLMGKNRRNHLLGFIAGILTVSILAVAALALQGTLLPFLHQMLWLQKNYAPLNIMPYGSVIGGWARLLEGSSSAASAGPESLLRFILVLCLALPAALPPLAIILWAAALWRKRIDASLFDPLVLLLMAMVAFIAACFPRADLMHLALVAALPYALTAAAIATIFSLRSSAILAFTLLPLAALFSFNSVLGWFVSRPITTPVGTVRASSDIAPSVEKLIATVRPGQSMFVYPYMPIASFLTQARQATRFCYLAPGMMTRVEEQAALSDLQASQPEWLLYLPLTREEFLRVFPHGGNLSERFEQLESWLMTHYEPYREPSPVNSASTAAAPSAAPSGISLSGYRLYHRVDRPSSQLNLAPSSLSYELVSMIP